MRAVRALVIDTRKKFPILESAFNPVTKTRVISSNIAAFLLSPFFFLVRAVRQN